MKEASFYSKAAGTLVNPLSKALDSVRDVVAHHAGETDEKLLQHNMLQLFVLVLRSDGNVKAVEQQSVATLVRDVYGEAAANQLQQMLGEDKAPDLKAVCAGLESLTVEEKETLLRALFVTAFADNEYGKEEEDCLQAIATELGISEEAFEREENAALEQHNRRMKLVRSSTGLIASVVVIGIFILTATFLKSVLFGLMLAYFFLPLQQRYANSFLNNGLIAQLFGLANTVLIEPFGWIIRTVRGIFRRKPEETAPEPTEEEIIRAALSKASNATVLTVALALLVAAVGFIVLSLSFKPESIDSAEAQAKVREAQKPVINFLENTVAHWPVIGADANKTAAMLKTDPQALQKIAKSVFMPVSTEAKPKPTGQDSLLTGATKAIGTVISLLSMLGDFFLTALMSLFFFSFFLGKMASFSHQREGKLKEGDYLVQSLFETSWLPTTSEETLKSAADVINEVFYKLKTWVRGYLWIIIIESAVYITVFALLGVPYALPLGMVAGLTVLLPFLGPLISMALTIGVCLVTGDASLNLCLTLVGVYFVMNSIIEQLFLYPALVGEALGLNVLETLIVVLLGGYFAGLAGMIFAVPVASVLKFLIPRLYQSIFQSDELELPGRTVSEDS
jgi:predicted PurR-regulated permease PerM